ncbi:hypothetical protein F66182_2569 [Fusarium sp. NRRL 66182]|nr:hypothetical protein F66182_2569 [Fusarium sp. NRRL 66182]
MPSKNSAIASAPIPATKDQNGNVIIWNVKEGYSQMSRRTVNDNNDDDAFAAAQDRAVSETAPASNIPNLKDKPKKEDIPEQVAPFTATWALAEAVTPSMVRTRHALLGYQACQKKLIELDSGLCIAACAKPGGDGPKELVLVYYVTEDANGDRRVVEYDLKTSKPRVLSTDLSTDPNDATRLCALYFTPPGEQKDVPYCFFQKNGKVFEYRTQKNSSSELTGITGARSPTPLAACRYQHKVYLFWLSSGFNLMYSTRSNGQWTPGTIVPAAQDGSRPDQADAQSDISVVPDEEKKLIAIYYKMQDSDNDVDEYIWKIIDS